MSIDNAAIWGCQMDYTDLKSTLPELHKGLGDVDFAIFQQFVDQESVAKGTALAKAGDEMNASFVVLKGHVGIEVGADVGDAMEVNSAGPGRWIGQMSFFEPSQSCVTIAALEDVMIGRFSAEAFDKLAASYPVTANKLLHTFTLELSERMRGAGKLLFRRFAWDQVDGDEGEQGARQWFTKVFCEMNKISV